MIKGKLKLEQWFLRQVEAHTLKQDAVSTADCVEDGFLRSYADHPTTYSLADERVEHVSGCYYCRSRLILLRTTPRTTESRRKFYFPLAVMGVLSLLGGSANSVLNRKRAADAPGEPPENRILDLFEYATETIRSRPPLRLPARCLRLQMILPRWSPAGDYSITVAKGEGSLTEIASAAGAAAMIGVKTVVVVCLDLRPALAGRYALSTCLRGDSDPKTYPLLIETSSMH